MKKSFLFLLITMISISVSSASDKGGDRVLYAALGGESAEGYDPTLGWGRYGSSLFFSTLLKYDRNIGITKDIALSYATSADRTTWTVRIRKDVKFSDGSPLTPADVVYTFERTMKSGGKIDLAMLDSVRAENGDTVVFRLKHPSVVFVNKLATTGIVPRKIHYADPSGFARHPVGSGPYRFVNWTEGQQLIVEANPLYYGKQPSIRKIVFLFMDETTAFAAAQAGRVDILSVPHTLARQSVKGMKIHPVKSVDNRGIMFPVKAPSGKTAEGSPIGNRVTCDPAIRKAVNYAIDRTLLVKSTLEGFGEPAYGAVDNCPWNEPAVRFRDNDLALAKKILSDAGWKPGGKDGILVKNGVRAEFDLLYNASDSTRQNLSIAVASMVRKIGVKINVIGKSWNEINERYSHSCAVLFGFGNHSPDEMYRLFHSSLAGTGSNNAGFYKNTVVDGYLDKAMSSSSINDSIRYWRLAQWDGKTGLSVKGDATWAWLVNLTHIYFVSDALDIGESQIEPHGHGWPVSANIADWKWR